MKKTCSIFMAALILFLSVININSVSAEVLGDASVEANENSIIHEENKNSLDHNTEYTSLASENSNEKEQILEVFNHDTAQLYITGEDIDLMAKLVSAESIGEPYTGKVAVASVVLNRTISPNFPNTIKEVIFQKNAFSCVRNGEINAIATQECYDAVYDAIKGTDPTNDALFFYNPTIATCNWMKQTQKINQTTIGHHTFFKVKS